MLRKEWEFTQKLQSFPNMISHFVFMCHLQAEGARVGINTMVHSVIKLINTGKGWKNGLIPSFNVSSFQNYLKLSIPRGKEW